MLKCKYNEDCSLYPGWIVYNAIEVKPGEKETDSGYTDYPNAWR